MKTRVAVVSGGTSNEREVSLRSGQAVTAALVRAGYTTELIDYQGVESLELINADVLFPVLHGQGGEDGVFQAACNKLGFPYIGSGEAASRLCFSKPTYLKLLRENGFPVASGEEITRADFALSPLTKQPFVLKPSEGGSSLDTLIVRDMTKIPTDQIQELFTKYDFMLLEELIVGTEITVGVLDMTALPVIEIVPPENAEFDYENKYNGATKELCPPQSLSPAIQEAAQRLAEQIHVLTDCRHYSRTDMIVRPNGEMVVLETNTLPGMTDQSLFPKAAAAAGYSMPELTDKLVRLALASN